MATHNPYAPSRASLRQVDKQAPSDEVRRDGKWVVVPIDGGLPPRCVKCNADADEPTKQRTLYWHHPGVYALLLVNLLVYAIVAAILRKKAKLSPGLCSEHKARRRNVILIAWGLVLGAFVAPFLFANEETIGLWMLIGILMFLAAIILAMVRARIVYAKKIDDEEVRLGGCGDDFLDSLPEY